MTGVFDHPWLSGLFGDAEIAEVLSPARQLARMMIVEVSFLNASAKSGRISQALRDNAVDVISNVDINMDALKLAMARDGVVVPEFVRQLKTQATPQVAAIIHQGMTSQDVIDTAFALGLRDALDIYARRLRELCGALDELKARFGGCALMGRTRMQAALPIDVADRIDLWILPLEALRDDLGRVRDGASLLSLGGPVGTRAELAEFGDAIAAEMARDLDLANPRKTPHAMRGGIVSLAGWLSHVTGALGKIGQDICLMLQQGVDEIAVSSGGTSSAMAHKSNPVLAELLVTLAKFDATQVSGMHHALIHEQERSGSAWALEWMIMPQMMMATGRSLLAASDLIAQITDMGGDI